MSLSEMIGKRACTGIRTLSALTVASAFLGFAGCDRKQSLAQMPARPPAAVTIDRRRQEPSPARPVGVAGADG